MVRRLAALSLAAAVAFGATAASAHTHLVSATPADGSAGAAPRTITLTFSERLVPAFSRFQIVNAAGVSTPVRTSVSHDGRSITGRPATALRAGAYSVNWAAASSDGHRMTGVAHFTVR